MYKVGIIGCGRIASLYDCGVEDTVLTHAKAFSKNPKTKIVAACDINSARLKSFGKKWEVKNLYNDYRTMTAKEDLDIVSICTPTPSHYHILKGVSKKPVRAVICEKPIAEEVTQAEEMVDICNKKGIILLVNHIRRWDNAHIEMERFIAGGGIGKVQKANAVYSKGLLHSGSHIIDLIIYFFGLPEWVWAVNSINDMKDDPSLDAYLSYKNNFSCFIGGCNHKHHLISEFDIIGSQGRLCLNYSDFSVKLFHVIRSRRFSEEKELIRAKNPFKTKVLRIMTDVVNNLLASIEGRANPLCSGRDALAGLKLLKMIESSAKTNRKIYIRGKINA